MLTYSNTNDLGLTTYASEKLVLRFRREGDRHNGKYGGSPLTYFSYAHAQGTFEGYNPRGGDILVPYSYLLRSIKT